MTVDEQRSLLSEDVPVASPGPFPGDTATCVSPASPSAGTEASTTQPRVVRVAGSSVEGGPPPAYPQMAKNKWKALDALVSAGTGGLTDFELADKTGVQQTSIGKRRGDLVALGFVEATDRFRPSPSRTPAIVWRSTRAGYERWLVERDRRPS